MAGHFRTHLRTPRPTHLLAETITVLTNDGRAIVGVLKGYDHTTNIVLGDCKERVFSVEAGVETVELGLYIVRGDNMCVRGSGRGGIGVLSCMGACSSACDCLA